MADQVCPTYSWQQIPDSWEHPMSGYCLYHVSCLVAIVHLYRVGATLCAYASLLDVHITLSIDAWRRHNSPYMPTTLQPITIGPAAVRTAHVAVGACILATASVAAIQAHRAAVPAPSEVDITEPRLTP